MPWLVVATKAGRAAASVSARFRAGRVLVAQLSGAGGVRIVGQRLPKLVADRKRHQAGYVGSAMVDIPQDGRARVGVGVAPAGKQRVDVMAQALLVEVEAADMARHVEHELHRPGYLARRAHDQQVKRHMALRDPGPGRVHRHVLELAVGVVTAQIAFRACAVAEHRRVAPRRQQVPDRRGGVFPPRPRFLRNPLIVGQHDAPADFRMLPIAIVDDLRGEELGAERSGGPLPPHRLFDITHGRGGAGPRVRRKVGRATHGHGVENFP